ncbi:MAG TPA: hypothetical protein VH309_07645, partial [Elusimicrobiota bacterium]|nr:hypothetical protein [Elusimicrobiota bacterium]
MKTLRRLLIALGAGLLALAAAVALLIAVLLFRPGALLNSRSAAWGLRRFGRAYEPKWKGLELSIRSPDPFEKEVSLAAEDFCFAKADGSLSGCFRSLDVRFALELAPTGVRVTELSRLDAKGERLRVAPAAGAPKAAARSSFD